MRSAKPSALGHLIVAAFRAGLLGAGVFLWAIGVLLSFREERIFRPSEEVVLAAAFSLAVAVTLARGYLGPVRSYAALAGRFFGGLAMGLPVSFALLVSAMKVADRPGEHDRFLAVALAGVGATAIAVAWLHGRSLLARVRGPLRDRGLVGAVALALAVVTLWPMSARLRCAVGSGEGCLRAAWAAVDAAETHRSIDLAERGCSLDSAASCKLAGDAFWWGSSSRAAVPRDRRRAESFYRASCALGGEEGCRDLHVVELHGRCERQSASACRELAEVYRSGQVVRDATAAARFLQQACLLGDGEACGGAR